jgi:hypothetical protein
VLTGSLPAILALLATAPHAPLRTLAGVYFAIAVVPALQLAAGAFFGWRAALALGAAVAALTVWQGAGPPRPLVIQPVQWPAGLASPDQQLQATLVPPARPRAARTLAAGGTATLVVCLERGTADDLDILVAGRAVPIVRRPAAPPCWLQFAVPPDLVPEGAAALTVTVRAAAHAHGAAFPEAGQRTTLVGGYTRLQGQGGRSGGGRFFDGARWRTDDLSPLAEGPQTGRYLVELRIVDTAGRFVEVWY